MSEPEKVDDAEIVEDEPTTAALTPVPVTATTALVEPAATADVTLAAFNAYNDLCGKLLTDADFQAISGKQFKKKSAWRKLSVAFGVSTAIQERNYTHGDDGRIIRAEFVVQAVAPNGRHEDGVGLCDRYERCCEEGCTKGGRHRHCPARNGEPCNVQHFSHPEHDIPATAHTRAKNRACADLYGFGEVSAEEMQPDEPQGRATGGGDQSHIVDDPFVEKAQYDRVRELAQGLPDKVRAAIIETDGNAVSILGVPVRTADNKIALRQSQFRALIEALDQRRGDTLQRAAQDAAKADPADPEQAPFAGAGAQPETEHEGKGFDGWTREDVIAEVREKHGVKVTSKKDGIKWLRDHGIPETDERPF